MENSKKKILRNHIPTVKNLCELFLRCLNTSTPLDQEVESEYLLELVDKMEVQLAGAKETIEE